MSKSSHLDLSVIVLLRNAESSLAPIVQQTQSLTDKLTKTLGRPARHELLVFDHNSTDNSLSALQLLSRKSPSLRVFAHTGIGTAIKRGARCAQGERWIFGNASLPHAPASWVLTQLEDGQPAAMVDGCLLGTPKELGMRALSWHVGGLWAAQRAVDHQLRRQRLALRRHGRANQGNWGRFRLEVAGRWSQIRPKL